MIQHFLMKAFGGNLRSGYRGQSLCSSGHGQYESGGGACRQARERVVGNSVFATALASYAPIETGFEYSRAQQGLSYLRLSKTQTAVGGEEGSTVPNTSVALLALVKRGFTGDSVERAVNYFFAGGAATAIGVITSATPGLCWLFRLWDRAK